MSTANPSGIPVEYFVIKDPAGIFYMYIESHAKFLNTITSEDLLFITDGVNWAQSRITATLEGTSDEYQDFFTGYKKLVNLELSNASEALFKLNKSKVRVYITYSAIQQHASIFLRT